MHFILYMWILYWGKAGQRAFSHLICNYCTVMLPWLAEMMGNISSLALMFTSTNAGN